MIRCKIVSIVVVLFVATACTVAPRESYVDPVNGLGLAAQESSKIINALEPKIVLEARLSYFQSALVRHLMEVDYLPFPDISTNTSTSLEQHSIELLCNPRFIFAQTAAARDYFGALATELSLLTKPPSNDLWELLRSLVQKYEVNLAELADPEDVKEWCEIDIVGKEGEEPVYLNTVYPNEARREFGILGVYAALKALMGLYTEAIQPILVAGAQEVDSLRRAAAIQEYLKDPENRQIIETNIETLRKALLYLEIPRHRKLKVFLDRLRVFIEDTAQPNSALTLAGVAKPDNSCGIVQSMLVNGQAILRTDLEFQDCYALIWQRWEPRVQQLLLAAQEYDVEANKDPTDVIENLDDAQEKLIAIANGEDLQALASAWFKVAIRVAALAQSIHKPLNDEKTREQFKKTFDDLINALQD